jgi:hypothetical protein
MIALGALGCGAKTGLTIPDADSDMDASVTTDSAAPDVGPDAPALDARCPDRPIVLERTDVETVFVMDGSGSMGLTWDGLPFGAGLPSRWMIVRDTLADVLPPFDRTLAIGAKLFPDGGECEVTGGLDIAPHTGAVPELLALFDRWVPEGGTPTAMALRATLDVPGEGPRVIVATMDGGPNCNDDPGVPPEECVCTTARRACLAPPPDGPQACLDAERTLDVVRESYEAHGTPVVIVGIDDPTRPDLSDFLDEMALAGGWARPAGSERRFFNAREPEDLRAAFGEITELVSRCVFVVGTPPPDDAVVVVQVGGEEVPHDPAHVDGWDWTDRDRGALAFFGPACDTIRADDPPVTADVICAE